MLKIIVAVVSMLASAASAQTAAVIPPSYANQTPYGNPATSQVRPAPAGYELVFLQDVGRHGSRSQTDDKGEKRALAVWTAARKQGRLTSVGQHFAPDLKTFQAAEKKLGYGRLSTIGKDEWRGIGRRTADNYRDFWTRVAADGDDVRFRTTSVTRTKQSASALQSGLTKGAPGLDVKAQTVDDRMRITSGVTRKGKAAIAKVHRRSDVRSAARHVLRRLYSKAYVDRLADPVAKALDVYNLYAIAAGMRHDTTVTFGRYVPRKDARVLALAKDAQNFYRYGPGVKGETSSYRQARPIVDDFFKHLDKRLSGGHAAAVFRLAHGETTMPFAAQIRLPGSTKQATVGTPFAYGTNPWRGSTAGRMAGNIEWAAYRNAAGTVLVTVRYNERPVRMNSSCAPSSLDSYFYRLETLKRCLL